MSQQFTLTRRVQFAETDMAGIVHFSNFFRMAEEIEHAMFRSIGQSVDTVHDGVHISWPRVACSCDYFAPARFEDELTLSLRITRLGEKSMSHEVEFTHNTKPIAIAKFTNVCCVIEVDAMKSIPIPSGIRARLSAFVA